MRRSLLILILAAIFSAAGCQLMTTHVTTPIKQSLNRAVDDYHHVTSGSDSRYIQSQGRQF